MHRTALNPSPNVVTNGTTDLTDLPAANSPMLEFSSPADLESWFAGGG